MSNEEKNRYSKNIENPKLKKTRGIIVFGRVNLPKIIKKKKQFKNHLQLNKKNSFVKYQFVLDKISKLKQ